LITSLASRRLLVTATLLLAVLLATHAAHWLLPQLFGPLASQVTDRLFALRSSFESLRPAYDDVVVHVAIDDATLRDWEDFYIDRADYARLVRNLGRTGVAEQLHDVIFAAPTAPGEDQELVEATTEAGAVFYGMALGLTRRSGGAGDGTTTPAGPELLARDRWELSIVGDPSKLYETTGRFQTFAQLAGAARGLGFLDIVADQDGVYRRVPLLARDGDAFVPSMPFRVVCDFLGVDPSRIEVAPGRGITLREARRPGAESTHDLVIPIDDEGRMIVNYIGPWGRMKHYSFDTVYHASDDRFELEDLGGELQGRIAVISTVATGMGDIGAVPTDPIYPLSGIHANVIHGILTREFLRELGPLDMLIWIELPLLAVLLAVSMRLSTIPFVLLASGLVAAYHLLSGMLFLYGNLILNIPRPVILLVGATVVVASYHYHLESKARAVLRTTFDAYFPPSVVDKIMAHSEQLASTAHKKELTILFSDISSFTHHTSRMEAGQVRMLLNEYFERMVEIVFRYQGTLDKFIGDGLMVFFGDPESQSDHATRGVRAAIEMQEAARELGNAWIERGDFPLAIRVGINTGEVIVGNMGSSRRLSYTVLGEPVNLAQRLESQAPVGGVLISERTFELIDDTVPAVRREPIRVKGIDTPIPVYEVSVPDRIKPQEARSHS
jgi:adenylate cyclase